MSWLQLSSDRVIGGLTPAEAATLRNILGQTTDQHAADRLSDVIAKFRDAIRGGGYDLDASNLTSLPSGLHAYAINMARWELIADFPALEKLATDRRKQVWEEAKAILEKIAAQEYSVESPDATVTVPASNWNSENKIIGRTHPVPRPASQFQTQGSDYANPDGPSDEGQDA